MRVQNENARLPSQLAEDNSELRHLLRLIAETFEEHQGQNTIVLDMREVVDFMDMQVITTGTSNLHNRALAENLRDTLKESDRFHGVMQGEPDSDWVAIDLGYVMVHIFLPELREHYSLEDLWAAADKYELDTGEPV